MKNKFSAGIISIGVYLPKKVLANKELEKSLDTSDEWIRTKIGVRERRIAVEENTSDLAYFAGLKALKKAKINPSEIDLIIVATSTPDCIFPSTACIVQHKLKATKAVAFDVGAVCSGFVYALTVGSKFVEDGTYRYVLVIGAEVYSKILDWKDRNTCIFFGDGAGAALLSKVEQNHGILSSYLGADGSGWDVIRYPGKIPNTGIADDSSYLHMDGKKVWKFVMELFPTEVDKALKQAGLEISDLDFIIPHQANARLIEEALKKLNFPLSKTLINIDKYGNTSAASVPIALNEALEKKLIKKGDIIALIGFGSGLTWGTNIIRWH